MGKVSWIHYGSLKGGQNGRRRPNRLVFDQSVSDEVSREVKIRGYETEHDVPFGKIKYSGIDDLYHHFMLLLKSKYGQDQSVEIIRR